MGIGPSQAYKPLLGANLTGSGQKRRQFVADPSQPWWPGMVVRARNELFNEMLTPP